MTSLKGRYRCRSLLLALLILGLGAAACEPAGYDEPAEPVEPAEPEGQGPITDLGEAISDTTITAQVKANLGLAEATNALEIEVDTEGGVVTLSGTVESRAQRRAAEQIARETEGVVSVVNNLQVDLDPAG